MSNTSILTTGVELCDRVEHVDPHHRDRVVRTHAVHHNDEQRFIYTKVYILDATVLVQTPTMCYALQYLLGEFKEVRQCHYL